MVGRGTSDSDANGNVAKVARMLWEGIGFAHAEIGYSGVAHPRTEVALERAVRLGFRRIVVFPYFLFTGILVRRIYEAVEMVAARHPGVDFVNAHYLDDHPLVIETFVERIRGIATGDVNMNCSLCKYRTQVIGFERDLGAPQEGHHHHVEGIGTTAAIATTIITATPRPPSRPSPPGPERQRRGLRPTARAMADYLRDPDAIYRRSFALIRAEVLLDRFPPALHGLVLRLVHACAMPEIAHDLAWHGDPVAAGRAALARGHRSLSTPGWSRRA